MVNVSVLPLWVVCENSYKLWKAGKKPTVQLSQRAESEVLNLRSCAKDMVDEMVSAHWDPAQAPQSMQSPSPPSAFKATEETWARVAQIMAAAPRASPDTVVGDM